MNSKIIKFDMYLSKKTYICEFLLGQVQEWLNYYAIWSKKLHLKIISSRHR